MILINKEDNTELMNRTALQIAKEVAEETGTLLAGDICNTNISVAGGEKDPILSVVQLK